MIKDVDVLIDELIAREGGYVNHPSDHGGPTKWGITEQVARAYGYNGAMQSLPRETAASIYRQRYWSAPRFDHVAKRFPMLAVELFDTGVNMGVNRAGKFLQRALNLLNKGAQAYPDIVVDGNIGLMTLAALDKYKAARGSGQSETVLFRLVDAFQACRYAEIAENDKTQEDFMYGWFANRVGA